MKLDNSDKKIIANLILAIGIIIGAYLIANPKSELEQCMDTYFKSYTYSAGDNSDAIHYCASMIRGK